MADENIIRNRSVSPSEPAQEEHMNGHANIGVHLDKLKILKKAIKECLEWVRLAVLTFAAGAIIIGVVYNFFATSEKDNPDAVFQKLYKFMEVQAASQVSSSPIETKIQEWIPLPVTNETIS